eukprot:gene11508-21725_t
MAFPTLLWHTPYLGLSTETGMEFLCLLGILLSFYMLLSRPNRDCLNYIFLWILYFSLVQVGQIFLYYQWDNLLLEMAFFAALVSPWTFYNGPWNLLKCTRIEVHVQREHDLITFWLVRWLLFRLMFASGIVKLLWMDETWWKLTALNWHYESQCIPTPLAWYMQKLPDSFHRLCVVFTYLIEIVIPFLFFAPVRSIRLFAFCSEVLLQFMILLTGNYNFFNLSTMTLCLSLLDDKFLTSSTDWNKIYQSVRAAFERKKNAEKEKAAEALGQVATDDDKTSNANALKKFTPAWFTKTLTSLLSVAIIVPFVPLTELDLRSRNRIPKIFIRQHKFLEKYKTFNSYGLFRSMTGIGGRPEVVIMGGDSLDQNTTWKEYNFIYKPGNLFFAPPYNVPHQPRLDWQMWFASLGDYMSNPWFVQLTYKLLNGEKAVLDLMSTNPFMEKPPKYIRSVLYRYHYTMNQSGFIDAVFHGSHERAWWKREYVSEYMPIVSKNDTALKRTLRRYGLIRNNRVDQKTGFFHNFIVSMRRAAHVTRTEYLIYFKFAFLLLILSFQHWWKRHGAPRCKKAMNKIEHGLKTILGGLGAHRCETDSK